MRWLRGFGRGRQSRNARERDFDREIRDHLDLEAEDQEDAGRSREAARLAALRAFGNRTLVREEVRGIWGRPALDALLQDIRYALRTMRRAPGFSLVSMASSALGIGACAIIFAIANFAVLQPLPVHDPSRLLSLSESDRRSDEAGGELSYLDFLDLRRAKSYEGMAASDPLVPASIDAHGEPQRHWGALVTANYFDVVQPRFALGGAFDRDRDDRRGEPARVVLGHDLWRTRFQADPAIVGRTIRINTRPATVVGVTGPGFHGTQAGVVSEFWIPFSMVDEVEARLGRVTENRGRHWLTVAARLRRGVGVEAARAELEVLASGMNAAASPDKSSRGFQVERAGQLDVRLRVMLVALFTLLAAAAGLVLLTSCTNVANLLLGRASARTREVAARMALGASRGRLVRQLLTESVLLSSIGGALGLTIAAYGMRAIGLLNIPIGLPLALIVPLDVRVLLFSLALSLVTGLAFGLVPALRATRPDLVADLKDGAHGTASHGRLGLRAALVVTQVAIGTVLLLATGLFVRSLLAAQQLDSGLGERSLLLLEFDPGLDRRSDVQSRQLLQDIILRARSVPGVAAATIASSVPLTFIVDNSRFVPAAAAEDKSATRVRTDIYKVSPGFFEVMGIGVLEGQDFAAGRAAPPDSVIVNEAFARAAFGQRSPIGERIVGDGMQLDIVGVVGTAKSRTIGEAPRPTIYLPILDVDTSARQARGVTLVVKTATAPAAYAGPVREAIRSIDPTLAVFAVRTMERHVSDALILPRLAGRMSALAGGIGLALATIGLYGVISFAVLRRRREIGIRLAMGARPGEILGMILRQGMALALVGTAIGLAAGFALSRFAETLLYGVQPLDVVTFVAVPLFLLIVTLAACLLPARAAARVDPVVVLKSE